LVATVAFVIGAIAGSGGAPAGQDLALRFVTAWARADYPRMYTYVDDATKRRLTVSQFSAAYRQAALTATLSRGRPASAQAPHNGVVPVPVTLTTRVFGTIVTAFEVPTVGEGSTARVRWSSRLLFPGLRPGEKLTRQTFLAPRAPLLARDGSPLAKGPPDSSGQRPSGLGAAGTAITGVLGPPPPGRADALRAAGVPASARVGVNGLERVFDARLLGSPGGELRAGDRIIASAVPRPGTPVRTTISPRLQRLALSALGGRLGGVIALRPSSGEILALAGIPLSGLEPPGSTFKMVTLTAALDAGVASTHSSFPIQTEAVLSGVKLQNANGESCGGTLAQAFAISCNSVFAPLGAKLGARRLVAMARRFGFDEDPGIAGAATSRVPDASRVGDALAVGSTAIGQGEVQATTLQVATVAATIAMGGQRPRPTLALGERRPSVTVTRPEVARTVRAMMLGVVRSGTGKSAAIPGVAVAGKTGTAELKQTVCPSSATSTDSASSSACQPNDPTNTDAWFAAFAPAGHPRIAVAVLLVKNGAGGDTAAPVARQMLVGGLKGA
jgi:cell division protein FtsI/penicillin-binding protein 2